MGGDPWGSLDRLITEALAEDLGRPPSDATSEAIIDQDATGAAEIRAKAPIVLAGLEAARRTFRALDPGIAFVERAADGDRLGAGDLVLIVDGTLRAILAAERTALNFLQRLSGIATETARFVESVAGTRARILDTRKTTPGWRAMEKYAVRCGGGTNHRMGLHDAILIKDNHIRAAGGVAKALDRAWEACRKLPVEVEVESISALHEALDAGAKRVLLDNMGLDALREAVAVTAGRAQLEASGGVTLETVRSVAETGVDFISVGALTHSTPAADLSLEITRP
ncbi:MAG: carboxylating nicotinate-nucleotide diphosphorylase [Deltaproteobacteria bacterium]|nr:carboxylating nicotinate-nucleotide diphosphorylase [Deltaproteobacteria bacterium]